MRTRLALCTLVQARRQLDGRAFSLKSLHKTVSGSWRDDDHTALGDARATRDLLLWLLQTGPTPLNLRDSPPATPPRGEPAPSTPVTFRAPGWGTRSVAALVAAFPDSPRTRPLDPGALQAYRRQLGRALDDGRLIAEEAEHLAALARRLGATRDQIRRIHRHALDTLRNDADTAPPAAPQLLHLAEQLGLDRLVHELQHAAPQPLIPDPSTTLLRSWRIACVGNSPELDELRGRAARYGVRIAKNVTKSVRFTAADDPDAPVSPVLISRRHDIPVLTAAQATRRLDDALTIAIHEQQAREQQRAQDEEEDRRRRRAEADAYWRHSWRTIELSADPGPAR